MHFLKAYFVNFPKNILSYNVSIELFMKEQIFLADILKIEEIKYLKL